jgi:cytochrome P450
MTTSTESGSDIHFDIRDPSLVDDPYALYAQLREECPVAHSDAHDGFWVCSRYEDIRAILQDNVTFSNRRMGIPDVVEPAGPRIPLQLDPPEHGKYRRMLLSAFAPERVDSLVPLIRTTARRLLEEIADQDECEFIRAYAIPLPFEVILTWMGVPREGWPMLMALEDAAIRRHGLDLDRREEIFKAKQAVDEFFRELMTARQRDSSDGGSDDVIGFLAKAEVDGRLLTIDELMRITMLIFSAGLHTTTSTLGNMMFTLSSRPDLRDQLVADPGLVPNAVEELMRYESIVALTRTATADAEVGGRTIREGDSVLLLLGSADRDESVFADADEIDFHRSPNPHVNFGVGAHRCLGSHLARMELQISLDEIHRIIPNYRAVAARPAVRHLGGERGTDELWLALGPS